MRRRVMDALVMKVLIKALLCALWCVGSGACWAPRKLQVVTISVQRTADLATPRSSEKPGHAKRMEHQR